MSLVALPNAAEEMAEDVFFTFRLLSPGGEAYIPPCFIMTAAREMGYYPTSQCLRNCLSEVIGRGKRLTFPLFLKLCSSLEATRTLNTGAIEECKRVFDVRNSGTLNRGEFRTILTSSAAAEMTSSEVEAIVELLDPAHTDAIQLCAVQMILMRCLSKDARAIDDFFYTPRSARKEVSQPVAGGDDHHLQPLALNFVEGDRKDLSRDSKNLCANNKEAVRPLKAIEVNGSCASRPSRGRGSALQRKRQKSPVPTAPDDASDDIAEESLIYLHPPKTTAPSPCTSGPVTRATSLQQVPPLREEPLSRLETPTPPSEVAAPASLPIGDVEKSFMRGSHCSMPPSQTSHTVVPSAAERGKTTGQQDGRTSLVASKSRFLGSGTRRTLPEPPLEELREVSLGDSCVLGNTSDVVHLHEDVAAADATVEGSRVIQSTHGSQGAANENASGRNQVKKKKAWVHNCCIQS
ncbi:hypothetical protein TcYC6_0067880 [Trypanosoma cruzi]|nr:hypothetical protein TcYC6_0067880 [Trypanosoma cruzi]